MQAPSHILRKAECTVGFISRGFRVRARPTVVYHFLNKFTHFSFKQQHTLTGTHFAMLQAERQNISLNFFAWLTDLVFSKEHVRRLKETKRRGKESKEVA